MPVVPKPMPIRLKELVASTAPRKSGEEEALATVFPATIVFFRVAVAKFAMPPAQSVQLASVDLFWVTVTLVRFSVPPVSLEMPPNLLDVLPLTVELVKVVVPPRVLKMPLPSEPAVMPLTVEFVKVNVLVLKLFVMPPPSLVAVLPLTVEFVKVVVPKLV